jgi:lipid IVA palmitoyltransferase
MNRSRLITALLTALSLTFTATVYAEEAAEPATVSAPEGQSDAASGTPQSVVVVGSPNTAQSTESKSWYASAWDTAGQHLSDLWTKGDVELYVPFWSYHLPFAYSPEKRASYTEYPAGGGLGKGWYNASGNWEGVYVMGFQDSHAQPMYMAGYGWVPTWNPINEQSRIGIGATVFLFMRSDINGYAPTPGILPMVTAGYGPIDVQMAYIPGGEGNGNVLFWWAKYSFK